ncbi:MAG: hypothetical protein IJ660_02290 [Alphaproteobacteria bacterium]|nr:hypothetical protein [Alphaproteobacteria bacterium]
MKKIILFKNGSGWLDKSVTIKYRKLALVSLCVMPVVMLVSVGRWIFSSQRKKLRSIDITSGWPEEKTETAS